MLKIKEAVIVEGRYDLNKLKQCVDAVIIETGGFRIFKQSEIKRLLSRIAEKSGVIILTDSDAAGFLIRNHLRGVLPKSRVKHAYIPRVEGKERRKKAHSKEGMLGVEGVSESVIKAALINAGATVIGETQAQKLAGITKADLYNDGLCGKGESRALRQKLAEHLELPAHMSANALLEAINILLSYDEYKEIVRDICND